MVDNGAMKVHHPHDHYFRESFRKRKIIRGFLQEYLPTPLLNQIELDMLQLEDGSYVDEELRIHQTDILYGVKMVDGNRLWLYLLFDHKSAPDRWVSLQLLRYMVKIWEEKKPKRTKEFLPPILPLVVYHGEKRWQLATDLHALFGELPEMLQSYIPQFNYQLHDFSHHSEVEIKGEIWTQVCLMTLRTIFDPHLHQQLPGLIELAFQLSEQETGLEYIYTILYYLSVATERVDKETMTQLLLTQGEQGARQMATLAQQWIQEGREVGFEEGAKWGIQQGIERRAKEERNRRQIMLIRLLRRHNLVTASELMDLPLEEVQSLRAEIEQVEQLLKEHDAFTVRELTDLPLEHTSRLRDELGKGG